MSSPLLSPFTIPASSSRWVSLYLDGIDELIIYFDISFPGTDGGSGVGLVVTNGYGSRDVLIPYPYNQPVPLVQDLDGTSLVAVRWSGTSATFALGAVDPTSFEQSGDLWVDMRQVGDYLGIRLDNADTLNAATVTMKARAL